MVECGYVKRQSLVRWVIRLRYCRFASAARSMPYCVKSRGMGALGEWWDGKNILPIVLCQVGRLDDAGLDTPRVVGVVEMAMWHHTKDHLLLKGRTGLPRTVRCQRSACVQAILKADTSVGILNNSGQKNP